MKQRLEEELKDRELFVIDDQIIQPHRFGRELWVLIYYRWRPAVDQEWKRGDIEFRHTVKDRPDYLAPKRKISAVRRDLELQNDLAYTWDHLKRGALYAVRDYFKQGGDGDKIPKAFQAIADPRTGDLNNYSMDFWKRRV